MFKSWKFHLAGAVLIPLIGGLSAAAQQPKQQPKCEDSLAVLTAHLQQLASDKAGLELALTETKVRLQRALADSQKTVEKVAP